MDAPAYFKKGTNIESQFEAQQATHQKEVVLFSSKQEDKFYERLVLKKLFEMETIELHGLGIETSKMGRVLWNLATQGFIETAQFKSGYLETNHGDRPPFKMIVICIRTSDFFKLYAIQQEDKFNRC